MQSWDCERKLERNSLWMPMRATETLNHDLSALCCNSSLSGLISLTRLGLLEGRRETTLWALHWCLWAECILVERVKFVSVIKNSSWAVSNFLTWKTQTALSCLGQTQDFKAAEQLKTVSFHYFIPTEQGKSTKQFYLLQNNYSWAKEGHHKSLGNFLRARVCEIQTELITLVGSLNGELNLIFIYP